jgi:hypothetical protein
VYDGSPFADELASATTATEKASATTPTIARIRLRTAR